MLIDKNSNCSEVLGQATSPKEGPWHGKLLMEISAFGMQGKRNHMEDCFDIGFEMQEKKNRKPDEWPYDYLFFGIFDGHGGCEAAKFAKQNLLKFITQQPDFWSDDDEDVKRAIRLGFAKTHSAMRQDMPNWARTSKVLPSTSGTTASVLFIRNGKYYTGHVGDSRIVLVKRNVDTFRWIAHQLTTDHKPESYNERKRIERAGGEVRSRVGVSRVVWKRPVLNEEFANLKPEDFQDCLDQMPSYPVSDTLVDSYQTIPFLAIARSLGDFWSINPHSGQYIVSPEPDVACHPIDQSDVSIVLATDGLWNVMNSDLTSRILEELRISRTGLRDSERYKSSYFVSDNYYTVKFPDKENYAVSLVYIAYQLWERRCQRSDNITAIVLMLNDILGPFAKSSAFSSSQQRQQQRAREAVQNTEQISPMNFYTCDAFMEKKLTTCDTYPMSIWPEILQKLQQYVLFPPDILEIALGENYERIIPPKNYVRFLQTKVKRLISSENSIYIKNVSDDPSDSLERESRKYNGKEVKDASSQATQCIHDFGRSWTPPPDMNYMVNLLYRDESIAENGLDNGGHDNICDQVEEEEEEDDRNDEEEEEEEEEMDEEDANDEEGEVDDTDDLLDEAILFDPDDHLSTDNDINNKINPAKTLRARGDGVIESKSENIIIKERQQDKVRNSLPHVRCLMDSNCTPKLRRSTRSGAYLSVTEDPKRKTQPSPDSSKLKRRKSHPVQYAPV